MQEFISRLKQQPESIEFTETMDVIEANYDFTPVEFSNGNVNNEIGENLGSCKIFALGSLLKLTESQTLACFGQYYRDDVLKHPDADDHANIRSFMKHGWPGITFSEPALVKRS